ncbi:PorP/SprF family type IX secretion system membrane protein [Psychroserpens ponticola]|uniref:PorP/SprF family type IX secretion system membrane protein n=1 Tax=Psychroserpens ponticola TaxID=2932268 RepID=A0ABY7S157_9FLAO|nr:PorP/SprF family type IX secretion system membrane protein [Psychroserpens ponticola]WCO03128.1 PorP/SprF family type IX secretion system membrane protein [Psychroserpens ponticola]
MKTHLLVLVLCICSIQMFYSQEDDGVVSLSLPVRNSLTFNRFVINPTFSFVREQHKYISLYNKKEWVQFDDAPNTYLASYSGRFGENIGAGLGLFQQNYGILTTFGGTANFAYNVRLARESNLTFGLNIGAYKSGVNSGNIVTNVDDPSLQNIPENFLLTINPGINYGLAFIDIGLSINNLAVYNFNSSELLQDNPEQGIQAHVMYTGYVNSRGFFDEAKFSGLLKSELKTDETIISAQAMLTVPKGIWAQVGYNTVFGVSGGAGINITPQIAIEYNFEKAIGDLTDFGPSHDITLAYRFKNRDNYDYSSGDEVAGLISKKKRKPVVSKKTKEKAQANRKLAAEKKVQQEADAQAKLLAEQKAQQEADAQAKLLAEQKAQQEADAQAKLLAEQKAQQEADAQAKLLAEQKAQQEADAQAKLLAEQKAQQEADAQAKLLAEQKAQQEADAQAKLLAEQKAQQEADAQAKLLAEQKAQQEADAQAKLLAEQKAQQEANAQAKLLAEQKAQQEADAQAKLLAEQKAQQEADAQAKLLAEQKAQQEADAQAKLLAEQKAQQEADAQAKLLAEQKAQQEAKDALITNPKDELGKSLLSITQQTEDAKKSQNDLLKQFDDIVGIKDKDLKDLKEENDLGEQGIAVQPKPFKSITAENNALNTIKSNLDKIIETRNKQIDDLQELYDDNFETDTLYNDEVYLHYRKTLKRLKTEQTETIAIKSQLEVRLENIKVATEFERRRRIKRAAFDNEDERYIQDRSALQNIKQTTVLSSTILKEEDFDFGEEQSSNIQILKNVKNVENGYYLIIAVHTDKKKRDDFVTKVVASGRTNVDFFYDVNTSEYYIYYDKFNSIEEANRAMNTKGNRPYNTKMSLVKIEN